MPYLVLRYETVSSPLVPKTRPVIKSFSVKKSFFCFCKIQIVIDIYFVYIVKNHQGLFYKGFTQDLGKCIFEHNNDLILYTSGKSPWILVYFNEFETKTEALKEELRLKKLNVASIERLIRCFQVEYNTCLSSRLLRRDGF
jgi:putative endonuclease